MSERKKPSPESALIKALFISLVLHALALPLLRQGFFSSTSLNPTSTSLQARLQVPNAEHQVEQEVQAIAALPPLNQDTELLALSDSRQDAKTNQDFEASSASQLPPRRYYRSSELQQPPRPLHTIQPRFPEGAMELEVLVLRLFISESGTVDEASIVTAGMDERFHKSALEAFQAARFSPGLLDGRPVPSTLLIEVVFDPNDTAANWEKGF